MSSFLGGGGGGGTFAISPLVVNTYTSNHTLIPNDAGAIVEMNSASANTVTVPSNSSVPFPIGTWVKVVQVGTGITTIVGATSVGVLPPGVVSVLGPGGYSRPPYPLKTVVTVHNQGPIAPEWDGVFLYKRGPDEWVVTGSPPSTLVATSNMDFYVATTGSDSNLGTIAEPFATIQHAFNAQNKFDWQGGFFPTIHIADGTYNQSSAVLMRPITGINLSQISAGQVRGNPANPGNVVSFDVNGIGGWLAFGAEAQWEVNGITIDSGANGFTANSLATIYPDQCIIADSTASGSLACFNAFHAASIFLASSGGFTTTITAGTVANIVTVGGAAIFYNGAFGNTFVFPATTTVTQQAFSAQDRSTVVWNPPSVVNAGGVTGTQLMALTNPAFQTQNGLLSDLPGQASGNLIQYDTYWSIDFGGDLSSGQGTSFAGPLTASTLSNGANTVVKDTLNGPRTLAYNDGGIVYATQVGIFINVQAGAGYTLALFDQGGIVEMSNSGANTVTVPTNASVAFPLGTKIEIVQVGAGATTLVAAGGVTGRNFGTLANQWASAFVYKRGTNEWVMTLG